MKDFRGGQLPTKPNWPPGPTGPTGPRGPAGVAGMPGLNLLEAGRRDFDTQWLTKGCGYVEVRTDPITVPEPSTLWASGSGTYVATEAAVGQDHTPYLHVVLTDLTGHELADTTEALMTRTDSAALQVEGWLADGSRVFRLQPGTSYRLIIEFEVFGSCVGSGFLDYASLNWAAYPEVS